MKKDEAITILSDAIPSGGPKREALECLLDLITEMENDLNETDLDLRTERTELRERLEKIADDLSDMGLLTNTPKAKFDFVWGRQ